MKNTPIIIPTYNRTLIQDTWNVIHPELHKYIVFVVRPEEAEEISTRYAPSAVDVLPVDVKDIMGTRQYIWDKYSKLHDYFFQLDDDIGYISHVVPSTKPGQKFEGIYIAAKRSTRSAHKGPTGSAEQQLTMFKRLINELKIGIGMTSPRPNWVFPSEKNYPTSLFGLITGFYAFNCKVLIPLNLRFDRWASCGDTDAHLQVLAHGIKTSYCSDYFYNIDVLAEHSAIRNRVAKDHEELSKAWGGYVRPRKTSKTGELAVMGSYTYLRKKLFTDSPLKATEE